MAKEEDNQKVNVYIVTSDSNSKRTENLQKLFVSDLFSVNVVQFDDEKDGNTIKGNFRNKECENEYKQILWILEDSFKNNPSNYVLYLKDSSVTNADSDLIDDLMKSLLNKDFDVCYLSKWLDMCDKYDKTDVINDNGMIFTKTISPNGIQSILINPKLRDLIRNNQLDLQNDMSDVLQKAIQSKKILATTISPNLFTVDISTIENPEDYKKLQECENSEEKYNYKNKKIAAENRGIPQLPQIMTDIFQQNTNNSLYLWLILFVLIGIIIFVFLRRKYVK
jgi:hypothetical protein